MINSRKIDDLTPTVATQCRQFIAACKAQGIDILITSTYRDYAQQTALYAQGRTAPGRIVTNAKAGQSAHNFRVAFDFVPLVNGKPAWDNDKLISKCGAIGEQYGLEWAGRWHTFRELLHFQNLQGSTLEQLRAAHHE
jgi:peptidoglycan LD-endopeptidase CwlK